MKTASGLPIQTSMEAKAEVVALILADGPETFAKAEAENAKKVLLKMLADGMDAEMFGQVVTEVCGNHSQMRQALEKHGLLSSNASKPAWIVECEKRLKAIAEKQAETVKLGQ